MEEGGAQILAVGVGERFVVRAGIGQQIGDQLADRRFVVDVVERVVVVCFLRKRIEAENAVAPFFNVSAERSASSGLMSTATKESRLSLAFKI